MLRPDPIELQRLRYQQGQALRSADRREQVAIEAQLRAWHNRAFHNAFGIAVGMTAKLLTDSVIVDPGIAYDIRGRELILQKPRTLALPGTTATTATNWLLLARFRETSEYPKRGDFDSACFRGDKTSPFLESPEFLWKLEAKAAPQDGVPLFGVTIDAAGVKEKPGFVKPRERGLARHRVVTGATLAGSTAWEGLDLLAGTVPVPGLQLRVDTSHAGFTQPPCYFAWLQWLPPNPLDPVFVAATFPYLSDESIAGFKIRVWLPQLAVFTSGSNTVFPVNGNDFSILVARQRLYVFWMAIEEGLGPISTHDQKGAPL